MIAPAQQEEAVKANAEIEDYWRMKWDYNLCRNIEAGVYERPCLSELAKSWRGVPALIVGAGPSARSNLEEIKAVQTAGVRKIVAVDAAYRFLKEAGINPDFTLNLDANDLCTAFFPARLVGPEDKFALCLDTSPLVYDRIDAAGGGIWVFGLESGGSSGFWEVFHQFRWCGEPKDKYRNLVQYDGVGFGAVDLAMYLGSGNLALIGLDLCWKTRMSIPKLYRNHPCKPLVKEGRKFTLKSFLGQREGLELVPQMAVDPSKLKLVNCSYGLEIKGWANKPLKKVRRDDG